MVALLDIDEDVVFSRCESFLCHSIVIVVNLSWIRGNSPISSLVANIQLFIQSAKLLGKKQRRDVTTAAS